MSAGAGETTVMLATSDLGEIVVDGAGMTLYAFTPDAEEDGTPTCYSTCAENWPPLIAPEEITAGEGLDATMFTAVPRTQDDAGDQVKFGDWPLYYFAGDEAPGDTNGQGLNDVWFVVGANGELIQEAP
jgi:predicted lipoprotein with Yx(FWY)xxD motif